ncbi:hypothetical protein [Streptosporangium canum]|uniref:hypothetical protein n=1 Tax=Streptosporangium canum TaxID=324952 RepID=UPI0033AA3709
MDIHHRGATATRQCPHRVGIEHLAPQGGCGYHADAGYATVTDPESRSSTLSVEVEHDPAATGQGSDLIWSGTSQSAYTSGTEASVTVPAGKLSDGWKLRWRARAPAGGVNGTWSPWSTFTIKTTGGGQPISSGKQTTQSTGAAASGVDLEHITTEICRKEGWDGFPPNPFSTINIGPSRGASPGPTGSPSTARSSKMA